MDHQHIAQEALYVQSTAAPHGFLQSSVNIFFFIDWSSWAVFSGVMWSIESFVWLQNSSPELMTLYRIQSDAFDSIWCIIEHTVYAKNDVAGTSKISSEIIDKKIRFSLQSTAL